MIKMSIEDLNLSTRAYNCLKKANVNNIEEMATVNLKILDNCGRKTYKEITEKINELIENNYFDTEFIEKHFSSRAKLDFVDTLNLSVRAQNILRKLGVKNYEHLSFLDYEILNNVRNAGKKTVNEILAFIDNCEFVNSKKIRIENISYFSGNTILADLPISEKLLTELKKYNITTVFQLIMNQLEIKMEEKLVNEYNSIYLCFYDLAYGPLAIGISEELQKTYIKIPFIISDYIQLNELYNIKKFIQLAVNSFNKFSLEEKINIKLFICWLNTFDIVNPVDYLIESFKLKDNYKRILSQRTYKTLEELGNSEGLTRERVRQIEANSLRKSIDKYKKFPFKYLVSKDFYIPNNTSENELILLYLDELTDKYYIHQRKNDTNIYFRSDIVNEIKSLMEMNKEDLENFGFIKYENSNNNLVKYSIDYLELKYFNNHLFKNYTKVEMVRYAMRYLNKAINISNKDDAKSLISTVYNLFGVSLEDSRGLIALIESAGIRVDSGTYAADDIVIPLDKSVLNEIVEYVKAKKIINTRDLFVPFGEVLKLHNIKNENILYRYLKDNLDGEIFFNGVSGVISVSKENGNWGSVIINYIKEINRPVTKSELIVKYPISDPVYAMLTVNFNDIIKWDISKIYLKSLIKITDDEKTLFIDAIKTKKVMSFNEIKNTLQIINKELLIGNYITNDNNLYYFLVNVLEDNFIINKDSCYVYEKDKNNKRREKEFAKVEELTL